MSKKIAAFGEVMMRLQVPGYELLSQARSLQYSFSGTGVNIAGALAKFGYRTHLISTLPDNPLGDAAESYLRGLGISTDYLTRRGHYIGMYFLENGFGARPSRVTYTNRLESSFNTAPRTIYPFAKIAQEIDVVHFCGITLAMNENVRGQMKELAQQVKKAGGLVVFDCNYRPSLWGENGYEKARLHYEEMLHLADIVTMNEKDALYVLGLRTEKSDRREQLQELIPLVAQKFSISLIAGTHRSIEQDGKHSLQGFVYKNKTFTFSEVLSFPVLDRIGAGDAFTSGVIHGELSEFSKDKTVDFATTAAMLAHTTVGDTPQATEEEIFRAMGGGMTDVSR